METIYGIFMGHIIWPQLNCVGLFPHTDNLDCTYRLHIVLDKQPYTMYTMLKSGAFTWVLPLFAEPKVLPKNIIKTHYSSDSSPDCKSMKPSGLPSVPTAESVEL